MILPKLEEPTLLADQVYATLHAAVINGDLPAGSQLKIRDLAAQVGTSVMPVREAIRRLEEAGLAVRQPHKGAVVKGLTLAELAQVYEVRTLLEGVAARMGAEHASVDACNHMEREFGLMRKALAEGRVVDYLDHDEQLLAALYAEGGNAILVEVIRGLWRQCRAYKVMGARTDAPEDEALWKHQAELLAAARAHDVQAAFAASSASLAEATNRIRDKLAEQRRADP